MIQLYQFPFSHYCEKTCWNLDAKGVAHEVRDVAPGMHRVVAGKHKLPGTVPIVVDGDRALGDSAEIASYLEEQYPERRLIPADEADRRRVLELQQQFDATFGIDARQWVYGLLAQNGGATSIWPPYYRGRTRLFVQITRRFVEGSLRKMYHLSPDNTRAAHARLEAHFADLANLLDGRPNGYLVGDSLTIADITAAALLGPAVAPPESPWSRVELPAPITDAQQKFRATPAGAWILERYRIDRR